MPVSNIFRGSKGVRAIEGLLYEQANYKQAKANNPRADVSIGYPAKLVINGRVVADKFPNWREVLRGSRTSEPVVRTAPEQSLNQRQNQTATKLSRRKLSSSPR